MYDFEDHAHVELQSAVIKSSAVKEGNVQRQRLDHVVSRKLKSVERVRRNFPESWVWTQIEFGYECRTCKSCI